MLTEKSRTAHSVERINFGVHHDTRHKNEKTATTQKSIYRRFIDTDAEEPFFRQWCQANTLAFVSFANPIN